MADSRKRANVLIGAPNVDNGGGALIGLPATEAGHLPVDATSPLNEALKMKPAGFIGEDGVTKTVDAKTEKIKDWNGDTVMVIDTDHDASLKFKCLETVNAPLLKAIYGKENVSISAGKVAITDAAVTRDEHSWSFEMKGAKETKQRLFVPVGKISSVGEIKFAKKDVISYDVTLECLPGPDGVKIKHLVDSEMIKAEVED